MQSPEPSQRPAVQVAVLMRRERVPGAMSRWQTWRWVVADVVPHEAGFGTEPRCLVQTVDEERWLHPGFVVELFRDDAEGYLLNASTPAPCCGGCARAMRPARPLPTAASRWTWY